MSVLRLVTVAEIAEAWKGAQYDRCGYAHGLVHVSNQLGISKERVASVVKQLDLPSTGP